MSADGGWQPDYRAMYLAKASDMATLIDDLVEAALEGPAAMIDALGDFLSGVMDEDERFEAARAEAAKWTKPPAGRV